MLFRDLGASGDVLEATWSVLGLRCWKLVFHNKIIPLLNTQSNTSGQITQSWRPGEERSKVFTGNKVLITRELFSLR